MNPTDDGLILYTGRFFETRLQPGEPPQPPLIILTLTGPDTNQSLVLTPAEVTELPLVAAATLTALTGPPVSGVWPLPPADDLAGGETPAALVFPTRLTPTGGV